LRDFAQVGRRNYLDAVRQVSSMPRSDMITTLQLRLPDGRQIPVSYPASPLMDVVVREVLSGTEYPHLGFVTTTDTVILDIGANVGCSAILFALQHPTATVYALEPASHAFGFLSQNTAPFPNIRNFQIGAFHQDKVANFFHGHGGSVTSSLFAGGLASESPAESVQLRRISSFLREQSISHISLLKIDTEGAELAILRDLVEYFSQIDAIHVEFHSETDRVEIDHLLMPVFTLYSGKISGPHRGILTYVARRLHGSSCNLNSLEINTRATIGGPA